MKKFAYDSGPNETNSTLAKLIFPLKAEDFFREFWDQVPFFVAGYADRFVEIMTDSDFEAAVFNARLGDERFKFLDKAIGNPAESLDYFLRKKAAWTTQRSLEELAKELKKGTLVVAGIQDSVPSAKSFCQTLFVDMRCRLSITSYFSAGQDASAFDAHFDAHDVIILQLAGKKEWRLWESGRAEKPILSFADAKSIPQPTLPADEAILMTPGDLLYVPRGTWHWPRSLDDTPSLHLTVALVMPTPVEILQWLIPLMSSEPELRSYLSYSKFQNDPRQISELLNKGKAFLSQKLASSDANMLATAHILGEATRHVMKNVSRPTETPKQ